MEFQEQQILIEPEMLWENSFNIFKNVCSPLRTRELFEWLYSSYNYLYLPSVEREYITTLADIKTTLALVDVAIDDACDNEHLIRMNGGEVFTRDLLGLLYNVDAIIATQRPERLETIVNRDDYCRITNQILESTIKLCKDLPRFDEFKNELIIALRNVANSMEFSYIVNSSNVIYPFSYIVENRSASTMVVVHSILDLMCSSRFDEKELGKVIPLFKMADQVAMLSNTIYTWPKEIIERDYSSPVLALALEKGLIDFKDFHTREPHEIEAKLQEFSDIIENEANNVLQCMEKYVTKAELKSFNAFEFIDNYYKVKESFKARDKYWD